MHHDQHHTSDPITAHQQDLTQVLQAQANAYSEKGIPSLKQTLIPRVLKETVLYLKIYFTKLFVSLAHRWVRMLIRLRA